MEHNCDPQLEQNLLEMAFETLVGDIVKSICTWYLLVNLYENTQRLVDSRFLNVPSVTAEIKLLGGRDELKTGPWEYWLNGAS